MADRWQVRECERGHLEHRTSQMVCSQCIGALSPPFEVVRAQAARSTDPQTSKKAASALGPPTIESLRGKAFEAIRGAGERGATAHEVERALNRPGIWKRISELKQFGLIRVTGARKDPVTGADGDVYVAA